MNKGKILLVLLMIFIVAGMVSAGIMGNLLKLPTQDSEIDDTQTPDVKSDDDKDISGILTINDKTELSATTKPTVNDLEANGLVCTLGSECASGFCKCTCEEEGSEEEPKEEAGSLKLPGLSLTGKLTLNLPELESAETTDTENEIEESEESIDTSEVEEEEPAVVEESCECMCAPCVTDADCGNKQCINGVCNLESKLGEEGAICSQDSECKSGKCETVRVGGFLGLGGRDESQCASMEDGLAESQEGIIENAPPALSSSTINAMLTQLTPLERKMDELESKAIKKKHTTQFELQQRCPGCHNILSGTDQAAMELKKNNVKKRALSLTNILLAREVLTLDQAKKIQDMFGVEDLGLDGKKIADEKKSTDKKTGGVLNLFGFVTKVTGFFTKTTGKVMDDTDGILIGEDIDPFGDTGMPGEHDLPGENGDDEWDMPDGRVPEYGCNYDGICEGSAIGETWPQCQDCHCGNDLCQEGPPYYETSGNCLDDCAGEEEGYICGDGDCGLFEICPEDCTCGDGTCDIGEGGIHGTCLLDCGGYCGNSICENREQATCLADCCGNGQCGGSVETRSSCPGDCMNICGDTHCDNLESTVDCYVDCGECGDRICDEPDENAQGCPEDCAEEEEAYICGDGSCSETENLLSCPSDCWQQGDGYCTPGAETEVNSPEDCGSKCGEEPCAADEDESCPECRGISYYRNILDEMYDSLNTIEDLLCDGILKDTSVCPIGIWTKQLGTGDDGELTDSFVKGKLSGI